MPNKGQKSAPKEDTHLANSIKSWASEYGYLDDSYVQGITNALQSQRDRNSWLSLDPHQYLPNTPLGAGELTRRLILIINAARNSLVFLPVALTWLAISKATNAFSVYTRSNTLNVINFLDFWQNGYGVLDKKWSIGHIATIDFQIILLVILITILNSIISQRWQNQQLVYEKNFEIARTKLCLEISMHAHKSVLKNLKNFRTRAAEEMALRVDAKTLRKLRSYEP